MKAGVSESAFPLPVQGFNPLMSPTLRKQLGTSPSPIGPRLYK